VPIAALRESSPKQSYGWWNTRHLMQINLACTIMHMRTDNIAGLQMDQSLTENMYASLFLIELTDGSVK
jgi:hypothetical protein